MAKATYTFQIFYAHSKTFRTVIFTAHHTVIFAIAQLSCYVCSVFDVHIILPLPDALHPACLMYCLFAEDLAFSPLTLLVGMLLLPMYVCPYVHNETMQPQKIVVFVMVNETFTTI